MRLARIVLGCVLTITAGAGRAEDRLPAIFGKQGVMDLAGTNGFTTFWRW